MTAAIQHNANRISRLVRSAGWMFVLAAAVALGGAGAFLVAWGVTGSGAPTLGASIIRNVDASSDPSVTAPAPGRAVAEQAAPTSEPIYTAPSSTSPTASMVASPRANAPIAHHHTAVTSKPRPKPARRAPASTTTPSKPSTSTSPGRGSHASGSASSTVTATAQVPTVATTVNTVNATVNQILQQTTGQGQSAANGHHHQPVQLQLAVSGLLNIATPPKRHETNPAQHVSHRNQGHHGHRGHHRHHRS